MVNKGCCRECKYADWDADGCACMIDGFFVCDASEHTCDHYRPAKHMTNADRIRQMTDEELVDEIGFSCNRCACCNLENCDEESCRAENLAWLKQEVSEDAGTD